MTISSEVNKSGPYTGDGSNTSFAYGFKIYDKADIQVVKTVTATGAETTLTVDVDYTVNSVGSATGTITYPITGSPLPSTETLTIIRDMTLTQEVDLENQGGYYPDVVEKAFDRAIMITQQLEEELGRAVKVDVSSGDDPSAYMGTITAAEAATATSETNAATSETNAAASASAAATSETNAATSETNAATSETNAAASKTAAASSASAASTSATNAASSASAASTSETNAATSETNAAASASAAATSETNAAASEAASAANATYENLAANGDIGTGATQVSQGDHTHTKLVSPDGLIDPAVLTDNSGNLLVGTATGGYRMTLQAEDLGTLAGNEAHVVRYKGNSGETDGLSHVMRREADGTDATTAAHRISRKISGIEHGYIRYGNKDTDPLTFGSYGSERMRIDGSGKVGIGTTPAYNLDVAGAINASSSMYAGRNAGTEDVNIKLAPGRTGNGYSYIDMVGDTTYTGYGLRIIRGNTGANAQSSIIHRGTGSFQLQAVQAASIRFYTTNLLRMSILANGNVGVAETNPLYPLHVTGEIASSATIRAGEETGAGAAIFKAGSGRTLDGDAYLDLIGDTVNTTYGLRIIRSSGSSGQSKILHKGSGELVLDSEGASSIWLQTGGVTALAIDAVGTSLRFSGTLKRITEGAADSGGTGYKLLRVPN